MVIRLEALSREFREGLPMELLYADDLVLMADSEELLMEKLRKWKNGMEAKGLRPEFIVVAQADRSTSAGSVTTNFQW